MQASHAHGRATERQRRSSAAWSAAGGRPLAADTSPPGPSPPIRSDFENWWTNGALCGPEPKRYPTTRLHLGLERPDSVKIGARRRKQGLRPSNRACGCACSPPDCERSFPGKPIRFQSSDGSLLGVSQPCECITCSWSRLRCQQPLLGATFSASTEPKQYTCWQAPIPVYNLHAPYGLCGSSCCITCCLSVVFF